MVLEVIETRSIQDRWFIEGQQYDYTSTMMDEEFDCWDCKGLRRQYSHLYIKFYIVVIDGTSYYLPDDMIAKIDFVETADTDMTTRKEKYEAEMMTDAYVTDGDYVKAAKKLFGINIGAKKSNDQADYAHNDIIDNMKKKAYDNFFKKEISQKGINDT